jgi:hypothetical protein
MTTKEKVVTLEEQIKEYSTVGKFSKSAGR